MRKKTICRSEAALVAGCLIGALGWPLEAQQPQPAPAAPAPAARPSQGAVTVTTPAVHVVQQGETLWQLAQQYLGDPLLWPEIYRLNTDVVEDPHWIFPGEELRLQAAEGPPVTQQAVTVTPAADTARAPVQVAQASPLTGPTIFDRQAGGQISRGTVIEAQAASAYRAVREGEYYRAGFLTEGQRLASGRVIASADVSMRGAIRSRVSANVFASVVVAPPEGTTLDTGTLLLVFRRSDQVPEYGEIAVPTGLLRVTGSLGSNVRARVIRLFERVAEDQEVLPVSPFSFESSRRAEPVEGGLTGRVIRLRDARGIANIQDVLFLDHGANDGVRLGDVFAIYRDAPDARGVSGEQSQGLAMVVSMRERTSTAVIIELYRADLGAGSQARLIRRIPS